MWEEYILKEQGKDKELNNLRPKLEEYILKEQGKDKELKNFRPKLDEIGPDERRAEE